MMDPNATLIFIRAAIDIGEFENACIAFKDLDEWIGKGGFIPQQWVSTKPGQRADGSPRMTDAQRNKLWQMCGNYNVPFREDDYVIYSGLSEGWAEGWIGGNDHAPPNIEFTKAKMRPTIYTGVSPEGEAHT